MAHLGHIKLSKVQNRNKKMRQFEVVTVSLKLTGRWSKIKNSSQNRIYPSSWLQYFTLFLKGYQKKPSHLLILMLVFTSPVLTLPKYHPGGSKLLVPDVATFIVTIESAVVPEKIYWNTENGL